MSDEGFLKRWSRRKRADNSSPAAESAETPPSNPSTSSGQALPPQAGESSPAPSLAEQGPPPESAKPQDDDAIDPATLPPIESLGPGSDYTVFLKKGVPEALRLAALRKAWATDPFIRDFRSPAIDYGWDFTTPDHALRPSDNVAKLLDEIFPPPSRAAPKDETTAPAPVDKGRVTPAALPQKEATESEPGAEAAPVPPHSPRRKHGGALPEDTD